MDYSIEHRLIGEESRRYPIFAGQNYEKKLKKLLAIRVANSFLIF